ncbi:sigma-70 family RNA polymerase sigma factor [Falsibacillus albus]|uniref:Sigma-70 family RNA polymerase sigma factor n=1 Tax=Falsibacillus albus TaxID=2478915 RepID=A0A3L7JVX4_9BACI|nr:sigma-70 family RNA polymerase sigma factor [Falsibacillus albus]RLQ94873.1 sigma-70 family RNA polymerase sigma factor [Falsibacillus albus]
MTSFEEIQKQYEPMIHKIVHSLNLYKNKDEFYQLGLIGLWKAYEKMDPSKGSFTSYAYINIKGAMTEELKSSVKREETFTYAKEEYWENIENDHQMFSVALNDRDTLLSYCTKLTENQTKWVLYTFLYGMTAKDIAEKEGVSISAVKKWRNGAKEHLKKNKGKLFIE